MHCSTTSSSSSTFTTTSSSTSTVATTTSGLFDCRLGDPSFWPTSKRSWCCHEEGYACENGCEAPCKHGGTKPTCSESVVQAASGRFKGRADAPTLGYTLTLETCPHCAACALADITFPEETSSTQLMTTQANTPTPIAWAVETPPETVAQADVQPPSWSAVSVASAKKTPKQKGCKTICTFGGEEQTCGARVRLAASLHSQTELNVCYVAYSHVLQQCPFCASCTLADTGCMDLHTTTSVPTSAPTTTTVEVAKAAGTTKPLYQCEDLQAGLSGGDAGWSAGKATWCCMHEQIGCASVLQKAKNLRRQQHEPYSCEATPDHPLQLWSEGQKTWCCTNKNVGCVPTLAPPRLA